MEADKEVHQTLFVNERGSLTSYDLRRRNSWWSGRCRSRPASCGREPLVANCKLHAQQVGCPSKISTMLAFNIITNSMPNRLVAHPRSRLCWPSTSSLTACPTGGSPPTLRGERRGGMIPGRWSRGELEESRGCLVFLKAKVSFKGEAFSF